jgi:peptidoglycan/xylan/chitin deacetylase (PgdA/CDA1 family)
MSLIHRTLAASLFPSILWHARDQTVHLTFDDGPHPRATPIVLDILKSRHLKATFFLLGENVKRYPDLAQEVNNQGHSLGNHALTHESLFLRPLPLQSQQIGETNKVIKQMTGTTPRLFRPPFGRFDLGTLKAASSHDLKTVMWDVDSRDYSTSGLHAVIRRVCRQTIPGSIVLFHDNDSTLPTLHDYLNPILDDLERRDLTFSPLVL